MRDGIDVLVVDDDEAVRTSSAAILRDARWHVEEASNGLVALEFLRAKPVGAVVLDLKMPVLDGFGLLDQLENPPAVVLVTAHLYDPEVIARREKVFMYLRKPASPSDLLQTVARAMARRKN
jgi:DNA-binding NtrC family response regulator